MHYDEGLLHNVKLNIMGLKLEIIHLTLHVAVKNLWSCGVILYISFAICFLFYEDICLGFAYQELPTTA